MSTSNRTAKRGRPSAAESAERPTIILDTAVTLFSELGYARTTIDAIATTAGVAKRTIYMHFGDKGGVFAAAIERQHAYLGEHDASQGLHDAAAAIVTALHSDEAVTLHRLVVAEALSFPSLAADFYARGPGRSIAHLAAVLGGDTAHADAERLYTLLLGEAHRRRVLGLTPAPGAEEARAHASAAIAALGFGG